MIKRSKRVFTKRLLITNCIAAWVAIFVSMYLHESQWIAISAFGLVASIIGYYMHIGHQDLVRLLESATVPIDKQLETIDAGDNPSVSEN